MTTSDRSLRVLVVEDDPTLRRVFADSLAADPGIVTNEAGDLATAVAAAKRIHRPVLLVDLGLPGAQGTEAVAALRATAPEATLVVITGNDHAGPDALAAGAHEVIIKGSANSHGAALPDAIRRAVARHDAALLLAPVRALHEERSTELSKAKKLLTPLVMLLAFAGSTFAAADAGAAAELRERNTRVALEWWAGEDGRN